MKTILFIGLGGGIGSIFRYFTSLLIHKFWAAHFPLATFITNILGCFLIGFIIGILEKNNLSESNLKWCLITGFCGGYTTFSTFGYENYNLFRDQNAAIALTYIGLSIFVGLFAVWFGLFVTKL